MSKTIEEILTPKPEARPRIYAYSIEDPAHAGLLKVGQTTPLPACGHPLLSFGRRGEGRERNAHWSSRIHSLSSIRNGGEGRGEEEFRFMRMGAGRISPLPSPLPARSSREEGKSRRAARPASWLAVKHEPNIISA
jgi:hypothetical protein